jgi:hypothetical protein
LPESASGKMEVPGRPALPSIFSLPHPAIPPRLWGAPQPRRSRSRTWRLKACLRDITLERWLYSHYRHYVHLFCIFCCGIIVIVKFSSIFWHIGV